MISLTKLKVLKRQRLSGVLGLALDGSRLDGLVLRRTDGALHSQNPFSVSLSLDPLTNDPELVGREIRNHLDAAGVRERHCVVGLPLKWALTTHLEVPELPEADVAGPVTSSVRSVPSVTVVGWLAEGLADRPAGTEALTEKVPCSLVLTNACRLMTEAWG